jgi:hypothetical protein
MSYLIPSLPLQIPSLPHPKGHPRGAQVLGVPGPVAQVELPLQDLRGTLALGKQREGLAEDSQGSRAEVTTGVQLPPNIPEVIPPRSERMCLKKMNFLVRQWTPSVLLSRIYERC